MFTPGTPRVSILGTGGIGKTSLAKAILHHQEILTRYKEHRFFVACDSVSTKAELAAHIGSHLGLKSSRDSTQQVVHYFGRGPPCLLILDNLETVWEAAEVRRDIEDLLSLLTDVEHLALIVSAPTYTSRNQE
jgi:predicted ATPase